MSFSDDDLKRLKAPFDDCEWIMDPKKLEALIARLEAAELCAKYLDAIHESQRSPMEDDALNQWRKAAGK